MNVTIQLKETSQAIFHKGVNTYQKGDMYCVTDKKLVWKYPLANIWRVVESYDADVE